MSLLLDARKKLQQAQAALEGHTHQMPEMSQASELSLVEHPREAGSMQTDSMQADSMQAEPKLSTTKSTMPEQASQAAHLARSAGQNLFNAKAPPANSAHVLPNRNLLLALGGTVLLLGIGAAYLWHLDSASDTKPLRPAAPSTQQQPAPVAAGTLQTNLVPGIAASRNATAEIIAPTTNTLAASDNTHTKPAATVSPPPENTPSTTPQPGDGNPVRPNNIPIRIEQKKTEPVDPLLKDAYLAYRGGKLEEAQRLYLSMFRKNAQNSDALLGLATIAQQRGENQMAAQYYARVLVLDPRNALANAGMTALSADDDRNESRLKTLLREQGNSAALHFALGNLYAGQSRWGEAQQAYFSAYTLESGNAEFAFNLAVSLEHLGQKKLAVQHYQRALELDQSHSTGFDHTQVSQRVQELTH